MPAKNKNILILILGAIAALGPFSIDMYLPGFPSMAKSLGTDISHLSLTLTSYFIGISVGQLFYGPLLDRFGRKKPLLIGLSIYLAAAVFCIFSNSVYTLIILRLLQALGGCAGMVASRAIVRDQFESKEIAKAFSTLLLVMGVAPIMAPTLGGYIASNFGWRYIFVVLSAFSLFLIIINWRFLPESVMPDKEVSLKLKTVTKNYISVFTQRDFFLYGMAGSVSQAALFAYISGAPFVLMEIYNMSEKDFGIAFGANAFGFIAGSQLNRLLLRKFSERNITYATSLLFLIIITSLCIFSFLSYLTLHLLLALLFSMLLCLGIINPNATALALSPFQKKAGVASALIGSYRMLFAAITSALISFFHNGTERPMLFIILGCGIVVFVSLIFMRKAEAYELSKVSEYSSDVKP